MSLKAYGVDRFAALIEQNVDQAKYLAELIDAEPALERMAPVPLNIVCFRYRAELNSDAVNQEILYRLQERGLAVPSSTLLGGAFCLRACLVNHRTRREDLEALVRDVLAIGQEVTREAS